MQNISNIITRGAASFAKAKASGLRVRRRRSEGHLSLSVGRYVVRLGMEGQTAIGECVDRESGTGTVSIDMATFEMTAYILRDGRKRIAWSKTKYSLRYPPTLLTGDFIDALKKSQKPKK